MKKVSYLLISVISFFALCSEVFASSNISMTKSSSSVTAGNSVTITLTINATSPLFSIEGTMKCSGAGTNASVNLNWDDMSNSIKSKSYSLKVTPTSAGTITCSTSNARATDMASNSWQNLSASTSVSVAAKPVYNTQKPTNSGTVTPKSSVNYLKSLEIEDKEISPKFNKETSDYLVELEAGTTSINVKAAAEHNKAKVTGAGTINVSEGVNSIKVVVTAENGSKRTYTITATVKEKDPIIVDVDGKKYTVIRKKEHLPEASALYTSSKVIINDEEIPVYVGDVTGYTLVGLKDEDGIINLFTYDEENKKYNLYREFKFLPITFYPIAIDEKLIPNNYKKSKIVINEVELTCYKMSENDSFVLLYGVNIETNNEGFYIYDIEENTLQRYNDKIFDTVNEEMFILRSIVVGLFSIVVVVVVASAIQGTENKFKERLLNPKKASMSKEKKEKSKLEREENENKKAAKLLEKDLKRKEKIKKEKKKNKKNFLENTNVIDITDINIKK